MVHSKYDPVSLMNDAAVLKIPWQEWMQKAGRLRMETGTVHSRQTGWGFPMSMNDEWRKGSELAGKSFINGSVINKDISRYSFSFELPDHNPRISRDDMMECFSGTGMFEEKANGIVLSGVISCGAGDSAAGAKLWISSTALFWEIMDQYGIEEPFPDSMEAYRRLAIEKIRSDRTAARGYVADCADILIDDKGLQPKDFIASKSDLFPELRCDGKRECCDQYWTGQMIKAVFFFGLCKIRKEELAHPVIEMPAPYTGEKVNAEFLCTEEREDKAICDLIEHDYFIQDGRLKNGTIFLWNEESSDLYNERYTRKECRRIISNIADGYAENGRRKFVRKTKNLAAISDENQFDIVRGDVQQCDLAFLGIGELERILNHGKGCERNMICKMEELLKELWEE